MDLFLLQLFRNPLYFLQAAVIVIFSVSVHEFCHAAVALACGDPTAAQRGHLTLNPLKQMGAFSLMMFALIGICWGAVPVDLRNLDTKGKRVAVALAGPGANLVLALLASLLAVFALRWILGGEPTPLQVGICQFFCYAAMMNFVLLILNLLPLPGLDGGNALLALLPPVNWRESEFAKGVMLAMMILFFTFSGQIWKAAEFCTDQVVSGLAGLLLGGA